MRPLWEEYFLTMAEVSRQLMRMFAVGLGLDIDYFEDKIDKHISMFRVLNYPDQPTEPLPGQLRAGAHSDYGSLTIVRPEDKPGGLQVMTKSGEWFDIPVIPGGLVVNIGDLMAEWTNDRWVSTLHRVVNPPRDVAHDSRRISLVFFHQPNYDAMIECLPTCLPPGEQPKHDADLLGRSPLLEVREADHVRTGRHHMSVGISLASFISADFVALFDFYSSTFDLPEVEELRSDIFRGADADGVTIGFSAPVVYEMLHIEAWADATGTRQYLTFECATDDEVDRRTATAVSKGARCCTSRTRRTTAHGSRSSPIPTATSSASTTSDETGRDRRSDRPAGVVASATPASRLRRPLPGEPEREGAGVRPPPGGAGCDRVLRRHGFRIQPAAVSRDGLCRCEPLVAGPGALRQGQLPTPLQALAENMAEPIAEFSRPRVRGRRDRPRRQPLERRALHRQGQIGVGVRSSTTATTRSSRAWACGWKSSSAASRLEACRGPERAGCCSTRPIGTKHETSRQFAELDEFLAGGRRC